MGLNAFIGSVQARAIPKDWQERATLLCWLSLIIMLYILYIALAEKVHLYVFIRYYRKTQTNFLAKPILPWRIPGTGEPGGLPSMGSHRVRHNWNDLAAAAAYITCAVLKSSHFKFFSGWLQSTWNDQLLCARHCERYWQVQPQSGPLPLRRLQNDRSCRDQIYKQLCAAQHS